MDNRVLYSFEWLRLREQLSAVDGLRACESVGQLTRYIGACPEWDPEINRIYRALDWIEEELQALAERGAPNLKCPSKQLASSSAREGALIALSRLRDELQLRLQGSDARPGGLEAYAAPILLTEAEQRRELQAAFDGPLRSAFDRVKERLERRFQKAPSPELERYLKLMDRIENSTS